MSMQALSAGVRRALWIAAFALLGAAIVEKTVNILGYTLLGRSFLPSRLVELGSVVVLYLMAILLNDLRGRVGASDPGR